MVFSRTATQIEVSPHIMEKYKHSPTSHNLDHLNHHAEAQFQLNIHSTKSNYEVNQIHGFANHNNSKIYGYIQSITKTKNIPSLLYLNTMNIFILCTQIFRLLYQIYIYVTLSHLRSKGNAIA